MKNRTSRWISCLLIIVIFISGCSMKEKDKEKVRDMDFTVVEETDVNDELKTIIDERKKNPFQLSYATENDLYLVVGYGEQKTGGYSITVDELYAAEDAVCIRTTLAGPKKEDDVKQSASYPFIVVRTEYIDLPVIYE